MILTIIFGLTSVVGLVLTIYYGKKANKLQKLQRSVSWAELQHISDDISLKIKKDSFIPDLILCPGTRGAILAELLMNKFERKIPIFVGVSYRYIHFSKKLILPSHVTFNVKDDWDILIPKNIFEFKNKKILVVDDFCLAGLFFQKLRKFLVDNGVQAKNIKVYCCTITNVTINSGRAPEYYSIITDDDNFYFPWGKANLG